ncbi:MAG: antiterminator LoaP [Defluviitaleaceae bacterium]|nr:antiterminator LoaP [Defluviitaleaceae bacterium]
MKQGTFIIGVVRLKISNTRKAEGVHFLEGVIYKGMYWYVLFVLTGYEQMVASEISRTWLLDGLKPFVPTYDAYFKRLGKVSVEKRQWVPGYVFLESPTRGLDFYLSVKPYVNRSEYALKILRHGVGNLDHNFELNEKEYDFLKKFFNNEYCVEMSRGLIEGNKIVITEGPLVGHEGLIKRIDRHKMEVVIEAQFLNASRELKVGLEIVKRLP